MPVTEDVENIIRSAVGGDYVDTFRLYDEVIETEYVRSKAMYEQVNAHFTPYSDFIQVSHRFPAPEGSAVPVPAFPRTI